MRIFTGAARWDGHPYVVAFSVPRSMCRSGGSDASPGVHGATEDDPRRLDQPPCTRGGRRARGLAPHPPLPRRRRLPDTLSVRRSGLGLGLELGLGLKQSTSSTPNG